MAFDRVRRMRVSVVAERLGISRSGVYSHVREGTLDGVFSNPGAINSPLLISERSVEAFEAKREAETKRRQEAVRAKHAMHAKRVV